MKIVEKAEQMAADGQGKRPRILGAGALRCRRAAAVFVLAFDGQAARPDGGDRREPAGGAMRRPSRRWTPAASERWSTPCWRRSISPSRATLPSGSGVWPSSISPAKTGSGGIARRRDDRAIRCLAAGRPARRGEGDVPGVGVLAGLAANADARQSPPTGTTGVTCKGSSTACTATPTAAGG